MARVCLLDNIGTKGSDGVHCKNVKITHLAFLQVSRRGHFPVFIRESGDIPGFIWVHTRTGHTFQGFAFRCLTLANTHLLDSTLRRVSTHLQDNTLLSNTLGTLRRAIPPRAILPRAILPRATLPKDTHNSTLDILRKDILLREALIQASRGLTRAMGPQHLVTLLNPASEHRCVSFLII
jgi:hypothetical protein